MMANNPKSLIFLNCTKTIYLPFVLAVDVNCRQNINSAQIEIAICLVPFTVRLVKGIGK
jgi:hypothetical protein